MLRRASNLIAFSVPALFAGLRIQPQRDQVVTQGRVRLHVRRNRAAVALRGHRQRHRGLAIHLVERGHGRAGTVDWYAGVNASDSCAVQPSDTRGWKKYRLVEIELDAAIERRPAHMRARAAGGAEEIQTVIFGVDARLLFGAVADAEVHAVVRSLGDGDLHRHFGRLPLERDRFDVDELKQRHAVQTPLRVLDLAPLVDVAGVSVTSGGSCCRSRSRCPESR